MTRSLDLVPFAVVLLLAGCGGKTTDAGPSGAAKPDDAATAATAATEEPPPLPEDVAQVSSIAGLAEAGAGGSATPAAADAGVVAATGELVSPVRSELAVRTPGRVGQVYVDEGARVRKGQPLLTLETQYWQLDLARAEAELARARASAKDAQRELERKRELLGKGSVAQAAYDRAESASAAADAAVQAAAAARDLARQHLDDAVLRSPIDGVVAERRTDVGERLGEATVAFVIVQTAPLKLRFEVPERYLAALAVGQEVEASVDPFPGETFRGRVRLVAGVVDSTKRTVAVETEFPNRDGRLKPGLFARVRLAVAAGAGDGGAR